MSPAADNGPAFEVMQLERLIREISPRRVLLMGPAGEALLADYVQRHPDCQVETMAPEELPEDFGDERFDLAFVSHTLERLDKRQGEELVARLRDLLCRRLLLLVPIGPRLARPPQRMARNRSAGPGPGAPGRIPLQGPAGTSLWL